MKRSPKHRDQPDILDWKAMKDDPGLRGMEAFFAPRVVSKSGAPELEAGASQPSGTNATDLNTGAADNNNSGAPDFRIGIVRRNIRPAYTAQDGQTRAENELYSAMYKHGTSIEGSTARRLVMGTRTLAQRAGMAYSTCQSNL